MAALRSGEFQQCSGRLKRFDADGNASYCCLGVLQEVVSGEVSHGAADGEFDMQGNPLCDAVPPMEWLTANGIKFFDHLGYAVTVPTIYVTELEPTEEDDEGNLIKLPPTETCESAASLNDNGCTFEEIADFLEPLIQTY